MTLHFLLPSQPSVSVCYVNSAQLTGYFSEYSSAKTFSSVPTGAPRITKTQETERTIVINWDAPTNDFGEITGYNIFWNKKEDNKENEESDSECCQDCTKEQSLGDTETDHTITSLEAYTWYMIQLQTYNDKGPGPCSSRFQVRTKEGKPGQVSISKDTVQENYFEFKWNHLSEKELAGPFSNYTITMTAREDGKPCIARYKLEDHMEKQCGLSCEFENPEVRCRAGDLTAYTKYRVHVELSNSRYKSQSNSLSLQTKEGIPSKIEKPYIKEVIQLGTSRKYVFEKLEISWQCPRITNGVITKYQVKICQLVESEEEQRCPCNVNFTHEVASEIRADNCLEKHELSWRKCKLEPYTKYEYSIRAWTSAGPGPYSTNSFQTELREPGKPILHRLPDPDEDEEDGDRKVWGIQWERPKVFNRSIDMYTLSISYHSDMNSGKTAPEKEIIIICKKKCQVETNKESNRMKRMAHNETIPLNEFGEGYKMYYTVDPSQENHTLFLEDRYPGKWVVGVIAGTSSINSHCYPYFKSMEAQTQFIVAEPKTEA